MTRHVVGEVQARLRFAINGEDYSYNNRKMGRGGGFAKCQAGAMGPLKIPSAAIAGGGGLVLAYRQSC